MELKAKTVVNIASITATAAVTATTTATAAMAAMAAATATTTTTTSILPLPPPHLQVRASSGQPSVNIIRLFSLSLTLWQNKLERLYVASFLG
jgi:hypothetical protein